VRSLEGCFSDISHQTDGREREKNNPSASSTLRSESSLLYVCYRCWCCVCSGYLSVISQQKSMILQNISQIHIPMFKGSTMILILISDIDPDPDILPISFPTSIINSTFKFKNISIKTQKLTSNFLFLERSAIDRRNLNQQCSTVNYVMSESSSLT
jgi:hypothetical protein